MRSLEEEVRRGEMKFVALVLGMSAVLLLAGWVYNHAGDGHGITWGAHGARQQMVITHEGTDIVIKITQYGEPETETSLTGPVIDRTTVIFPAGGEVHKFLLNELKGETKDERHSEDRSAKR